MLCEKCGQDADTITCQECGKDVVPLGDFCYLCGKRLARAAGPTRPIGDTDVDEVDLSSRILCSDGACIGVVNEQGVCKVCGKPYEQEKE